MVIKMPREIEQAFSDYKMNLLQVSASEQYQFQNENVQTAFETARYLYQGAFDKVQKQLGNRKIPSDVGAMIGVMTNSRLLIEEAMESKGGIDMCTALEQLEKKARNVLKRRWQYACQTVAWNSWKSREFSMKKKRP